MADQVTAPGANACSTGPSAPGARRDRKLAALEAQLRQQGRVIEGYRLKLQHATERAEADERLLAEQATLLVKISRDLKMAVENLRAVVVEAGEDVVRVGTLVRIGDWIAAIEKIGRDERNIVTLTVRIGTTVRFPQATTDSTLTPNELHRRACHDDDCKCYGMHAGVPISRNEARRISADGP